MKQSDKYNHLQAKSALHSSLDGSIDEVQLKKLEQHLEICAECRAYAEAMAGIEVQLKQSLQSRWPEIKLKETELASVRSEVLTGYQKPDESRFLGDCQIHWMGRISHSIRQRVGLDDQDTGAYPQPGSRRLEHSRSDCTRPPTK